MAISKSERKTVISVRDVSKFFAPTKGQGTLKQAFTSFYKRDKDEIKTDGYWALKDISFEVKKGEFFGIVGRNGCGKSTLLKMIAGIYQPTDGKIETDGKIVPFIELGVGFNPELSGKDNVYLNGALLGFTRKEMIDMYEEIVDFAELQDHMDVKLKNFSSGMQVRLAFSIAIRAKSDILLLDEILAVGDLDFQKKCYEYFVNIKKSNQTVVLVTHDMSVVRRFCDRCIYIQSGNIVKEGTPREIAEFYETVNLRSAENRLEKVNKKQEAKINNRDGVGGAEIITTETFNTNTNKPQNTFNASENIGVRIKFNVDTLIDCPSLGFIFQDDKDATIFATNNHTTKLLTKKVKPGTSIVLETIVDNVFTNGLYKITAAIESDDFSVVYDRVKYLHSFMIGGHDLGHATTHPKQDMKVIYHDKK